MRCSPSGTVLLAQSSAASVMAGEVRVGASERRALKPGELVDVEERVSIDERPT